MVRLVAVLASAIVLLTEVVRDRPSRIDPGMMVVAAQERAWDWQGSLACCLLQTHEKGRTQIVAELVEGACR